MSNIRKLTWQDIEYQVSLIIKDNHLNNSSLWKYVYGVPRGGISISIMFAQRLSLKILTCLDRIAKEEVLIIDDIIDSGKTKERYIQQGYHFIALYQAKQGEWLEFPWETMINEAPAQDAITRIIESIGEDPNRQGLQETPKRVIESYEYLFSGYDQKPEDIIKVFDSDGYDQIVLLKDIELYSMCEHHMLPFIGKAHIAYIPDKEVIGVSKLARLMEIYSRRLQIQERLTVQITDVLMKFLEPIGAACIIEAEHLCMRMRGIEKQNSTMITSSLKGVFIDDLPKGIAAREELMRLIK